VFGGNPCYMSPELLEFNTQEIKRYQEEKPDLWTVGIMAY